MFAIKNAKAAYLFAFVAVVCIGFAACGNGSVGNEETREQAEPTSAVSTETSFSESKAVDLSYDGSKRSGNNPNQNAIEKPKISELKDGAQPEDYVEYVKVFFAAMEYASATGDLSVARSMVTEDCESCSKGFEFIKGTHSKGQYSTGKEYEFGEYEFGYLTGTDIPVLTIDARSNGSSIMTGKKVIETNAPKSRKWQFTFRATETGAFLIAGIASKVSE